MKKRLDIHRTTFIDVRYYPGDRHTADVYVARMKKNGWSVEFDGADDSRFEGTIQLLKGSHSAYVQVPHD